MIKPLIIITIFVLVASLSTSSFVEPAFAEKKSVFNGISDAIKYPFHSTAKAVGWDGTPSKFSGQKETTKSIPTLPLWLCEILFGVWEKFEKDNSSILLNLINSCSGHIEFEEKLFPYKMGEIG